MSCLVDDIFMRYDFVSNSNYLPSFKAQDLLLALIHHLQAPRITGVNENGKGMEFSVS